MQGSSHVLQKLLLAFGSCLAGTKIIRQELLPLGAWRRFSTQSITRGRGSGEGLQGGAGKVAGDALTPAALEVLGQVPSE